MCRDRGGESERENKGCVSWNNKCDRGERDKREQCKGEKEKGGVNREKRVEV